jgi:KaiC/GvpD/RAD55 family RecA-like ATPase
MVEYPISCVLGVRGSGKTLFMTSLAYKYAATGKKIIANYHLIDIEYTYMTFEEISKLPDELYNAVVLLDEIQIGADSYEIFKKSNKMITTFATQLRKRKIVMYYSTQVFTQTTKRLREQTNYIIQVENTNQKGISKISVFDREKFLDEQHLKSFVFDGRPYFNYYNTDEVVKYSETEIKEGIEI